MAQTTAETNKALVLEACDLLFNRIENGIFVERWDVIQDEATAQQSKNGNPMFGERSPE